MKKIFTMMLATSLMALCFTACNQNNGGGDTPDPKDEPKEMSEVLKAIDAIQVAYYPSYSNPGEFYDYSIGLYNSKTMDNLPIVLFDIYPEKENAYAGKWSVEDGNLDISYGYIMYLNGKDTLSGYLGDAAVTIAMEGEKMHVYGMVATERKDTFYVNVTAVPEIFNADYPYEPEETVSLNLKLEEGELDPTYADYGELDIYAVSSDERYEMGLSYYFENGITADSNIPDGKYSISYEDETEMFFGGLDYYGFPMGCYLADYDNEAIYYLASGTVTISEKGTKCVVDAKSGMGSTIKAEFTYEVGEPMDLDDLWMAPKKMAAKKHAVRRGGEKRVRDMKVTIIK